VGDLPIDVKVYNDSKIKYGTAKKFLKEFEINCWKKADLIITNSHIVSKEIQKFVRESKIEYFPFNVDSKFFKKSDQPNENKIVYTGMIGPAQNIETFIESISLVIKEIPDLKLDLYGWGRSEEKLKKLIYDLNLEKNCKINKPVPREEIPIILSRCVAGLVPLNIHESLRYAMPTKAFEYMSCSLPIFSYGASEELEENIKKSGAGVFVKSNDPKELAKKLTAFLKDKNSLKQYASNGRRFIENQSDYSNILKQL
jgi:glycosyltransferase involved in cell wall biosynthesis